MSELDLVIIDYGVGNLLSVRRGFRSFRVEVEITSDPDRILDASHVVLPGVGAFANAMNALQELDLVPALKLIGERKKPLLGICLGMQLLLDQSEEFGSSEGLGLISGKVVEIPESDHAQVQF